MQPSVKQRRRGLGCFDSAKEEEEEEEEKEEGGSRASLTDGDPSRISPLSLANKRDDVMLDEVERAPERGRGLRALTEVIDSLARWVKGTIRQHQQQEGDGKRNTGMLR